MLRIIFAKCLKILILKLKSFSTIIYISLLCRCCISLAIITPETIYFLLLWWVTVLFPLRFWKSRTAPPDTPLIMYYIHVHWLKEFVSMFFSIDDFPKEFLGPYLFASVTSVDLYYMSGHDTTGCSNITYRYTILTWPVFLIMNK